MAEFTVSGERNGQQVSVTWRDGELSSSDSALVEWIRYVAELNEGVGWGTPGSPTTRTNHLRSPYSAYAIIRSMFPGRPVLDQSLPRIKAPPGAII